MLFAEKSHAWRGNAGREDLTWMAGDALLSKEGKTRTGEQSGRSLAERCLKGSFPFGGLWREVRLREKCGQKAKRQKPFSALK